jgi:hypothetical protein
MYQSSGLLVTTNHTYVGRHSLVSLSGPWDVGLDHPLKMTEVPIPINKFQIDIFGKQTRPNINSAPK